MKTFQSAKSLHFFFKAILLIALQGWIASEASSQIHCNRWSAGVNYTIALPQDQLQDNGFLTAHGATFNFLYRMAQPNPSANLHFGGRISAGRTQGKRNRILLIDPYNAPATSSVYNTLVDLLLVTRLELMPLNRIQPYFDIAGGGRFTGTQQSIRMEQVVLGYERQSAQPIVQSAEWAYQLGSGILVRMNRNVFLDFGVSYTKSSLQTYANLDKYAVVNDVPELEIKETPANTLQFHFGVHFKLDCGDTGKKRYRKQRSTRRVPRYKKTPRPRRSPNDSGKIQS